MTLTNPTKVYNYARMTTATTGTGTITLGSAVAPYLTFAQAGVSDGDVLYYSIVDGTSNVECGIGTYTAAGTTLSRTTVLRSSGASNTGKISLSGAAEVHVEFLCDGVNGNMAWADAAASKSDQQTGTSVITAVTPGHQQDHPSACKASVNFVGSTGSINEAYNVSSVTRSSAGVYVVNFTTSFANTNYRCHGNAEDSNLTQFIKFGSTTNKTVSSVQVIAIASFTPTTSDPANVSCSFFGTQ